MWRNMDCEGGLDMWNKKIKPGDKVYFPLYDDTAPEESEVNAEEVFDIGSGADDGADALEVGLGLREGMPLLQYAPDVGPQ